MSVQSSSHSGTELILILSSGSSSPSMSINPILHIERLREMGCWGISTLLVWSVSPTSLPRVVIPLRGSQAFVGQVNNWLFNLGSKETSTHYFLLAVGSRASECVSCCWLLMLSIHSTEERGWNSAD